MSKPIYQYDPLNIEFPEDEKLPERMERAEALAKERVFRTGCSSQIYLRIEKEATDRGIKPYGLTQKVMTLYVYRQLVYVGELPQELQQAIVDYYRGVDQPLTI